MNEITNNTTKQSHQKKEGLGNATKFGMAGIAIALLLLGFAFAEVITFNSIVLATVLTMGFIAPLVAGILEFTRGESYRSTSFLLSSLFFLTFYIAMTRTLGTTTPDHNALGVFFIAWTIVNLLLMCATMFKRMDAKMITLYVILGLFSLFTLLFAIAQFTQSRPVLITAGALAIATSVAIFIDYACHICCRIKHSIE